MESWIHFTYKSYAYIPITITKQNREKKHTYFMRYTVTTLHATLELILFTPATAICLCLGCNISLTCHIYSCLYKAVLPMATSFRTSGMSLVAGFRKWFPLVPCDLLPVVELLTILTHCLQGTAPGRWGWDFKCVNLKHNMEIDIFSIQINIIVEWKPEDPVDGTSAFPWEMWRRFEKVLIFKLIIQQSSLGFHCEIALRWMPQNLTDD